MGEYVFCTECGNKCDVTFKFCNKCGNALVNNIEEHKEENEKVEEKVSEYIQQDINVNVKCIGKRVVVNSNKVTVYKTIGKDLEIPIDYITDIRCIKGSLKENGTLYIKWHEEKDNKENISFYYSNNNIIEEIVKGINEKIKNPNNNFTITDKPKIGFLKQAGIDGKKDMELKSREACNEKSKLEELKKQGIPYCPKCHSTSLSANKRGWKLATGLLGSSKVLVTCLNCGYKFKPGKK